MAKNPLPSWYKGQLYDCDRCGFTFGKSELIEQDGFLLCKDCLDEEVEDE